MTDDAAILDEILNAEGWPRFVHDPNDRGGATKGGITLATLAAWRGRATSIEDLQALTEEEARAIYQVRYIIAPRYDYIPDPLLRWQVVDCGVLHGPVRATRWLQEALAAGLVVDGVIGDQTKAALADCIPHVVGLRLAAIRCRFVGEIVSDNYLARREGRTTRDQASFALGWLNRATRFLELEAGRAA